MNLLSLPSNLKGVYLQWKKLQQVHKLAANKEWYNVLSLSNELTEGQENDFFGYYYKGIGNTELKLFDEALKFFELALVNLKKNKFPNIIEEYEQEILGRGYAYFEKVDVQVKKKKNFVLMMQLLNPSFSSKIKVYHDPYAAETMSVGVGPVSTGGDDKSYFIHVNGEDRAYKMEKKDYKEKFEELFGDCSAVMKKYGAKIKWSEFPEALHMYSTECN